MAIRLTGLASGMDTESIIKELMSAQKTKLTKIQNKKTKNTWTQDKWKELNTKLYSLYTDKVSSLRLQGGYTTKKASSSNESAVKATAASGAPAGTQQIQITQLASTQNVTGAKTTGLTGESTFGVAGDITLTVGGTAKVISVKADTKISDFIADCKDAGINASFDATQGRVFMSAKDSGEANKFTLDGNADVLKKIGLQAFNGTKVDAGTDASGMTVVAAADAKVTLNGAALSSTTNTLTANGITYQLNAVTDSPVSVNVSNDVDEVYNKIKDFITSYNDILKDMNTKYYAGSAKGYTPLTDEEKESMSDEQIKLWEDKIKDSLLRRDTSLGTVITGMKAAMNTTVAIERDGKKEVYSLSSFGICTSGDYSEKGLLHIYGEPTDATYGSDENKLKKALEEDPDLVAEVLAKITNELSKTMQDQMKKTSLSGALTFYNDKQLEKNDKDYSTQITNMEKKLATLENKYYKQFSAMETAMAKLQSQQNSLAGLFG